MDVMATEHSIAGTLVEHTELAKDDMKLRITLCDDGKTLETAVTYMGVGTRVLYQGDSVVAAGRMYNEALKLFAGEGFTGNTAPLDGVDLTDKIVSGRLS